MGLELAYQRTHREMQQALVAKSLCTVFNQVVLRGNLLSRFNLLAGVFIAFDCAGISFQDLYSINQQEK